MARSRTRAAAPRGNTSTGVRGWAAVLGAAACALAPASAAAHHVMGGRLPATFMEGLLSGLGHPVIGPDHLAFIVAVGIAAAFLPSGLALIIPFIACSSLGVMAHVAQLDVPLAEPLVAVSVLLAGAALVWSRGAGNRIWLALSAVAGLLHGYAFGESIVGAERGVLGAYLLGLAAIAAVIAVIAMLATRRLAGTTMAGNRGVTAAGAVLTAAGAVLLAGNLIGG